MKRNEIPAQCSAYWFWPSWSQEIDRTTWQLAPSGSWDTILQFVWPSGAGSLQGVRLWGAFLEPGMVELIVFDMLEWGFEE